MFILYALVFGLIVGFASGGAMSGLAQIRFRWGSVVVAGFLVQVALFSDAVVTWVGDLGPVVYVASTAVVLLAVLANWRITGIPVVVAGAVSNLAAIVANGGYMPAGAGALAALGKTTPTVYSNSAYLEHPALEPLTDILALPAWLPFSNIFSIGDVLIGAGVAIAIVAAMHRSPVGPSGLLVPESDVVHGGTSDQRPPRPGTVGSWEWPIRPPTVRAEETDSSTSSSSRANPP